MVFRKIGLALVMVAQVSALAAPALADAPDLAPGTRLYLELDENVSSARGGDDVGTIVRCRVWRDVESAGVVVIKGGTPATCRVDKVSRRNVGGFEGKISVGGVETQAVDGQTVTLSGGYNKEGSGHKVLVLAVGLLLLWPVLLVPGGNAELPPGTVFDVSTVNTLRLKQTDAPQEPRKIDLRGMNGAMSAEFMTDDFVNQPKHDTFRIKVTKDGQLPEKLYIDSINGKPVDAIPLTVKTPTTTDGTASAVAEVGAKKVTKSFVKGINRFEVAYDEEGQRHSTEVIMDVQM